jgi:hypothetical protein
MRALVLARSSSADDTNGHAVTDAQLLVVNPAQVLIFLSVRTTNQASDDQKHIPACFGPRARGYLPQRADGTHDCIENSKILGTSHTNGTLMIQVVELPEDVRADVEARGNLKP